MGMTVNASMSMQHIGAGSSVETAAYDKLKKKEQQIENNDGLTDRQKELQLQEIEKQQELLSQQIAANDEKQEQQENKGNLKKRAEELMSIYDAETTKSMLKMEKLMTVAVATDHAQASDEAVTMSEGTPDEVVDEIASENQVYEDTIDEMKLEDDKEDIQ